MNPDRLGAVDATYLAVEEPRAPLHVASIAIFERGPLCDDDGNLRLDTIRRRIDSRLGLLPRLRQRIADVPFGAARQVWIDDEDFNIDNHVDAVALPEPGGEADLLRLAERLVMEPLDRSRPLWHLRFVTGLADDRVAARSSAPTTPWSTGCRVWTCRSFSSTCPPTPRPMPVASWAPSPAPSPLFLLVDGVRDRASVPLEAMLRVLGSVRHPVEVAHGVAEVAGSLASLRADGLRAPRSSLNQQIGSARRLAVVRQQLEAVRSAGKPFGATVNDVVLAAVAGGVRELLLARGEPLAPDQKLKILVPVSVRTSGEAMGLGNRVGALLTPLPIGIGDPHARLEAIAETTRTLKQGNEAATADGLLQAADLLPPSIVRIVQRGVHHQRLVNMVVTNVPGPPFPLYALGARMLEAFPIVPLGGNMSLEVAILSYDGALNLGVTSDRDTCPDADLFVHGVERAFDILGAPSASVVV